jgi:hypothetical protein
MQRVSLRFLRALPGTPGQACVSALNRQFLESADQTSSFHGARYLAFRWGLACDWSTA